MENNGSNAIESSQVVPQTLETTAINNNIDTNTDPNKPSVLAPISGSSTNSSAIQNKLLNITTTSVTNNDNKSNTASLEESIRLIDDLKYFLATAPANWQPNQIIRRYYLNHEEGFVSCIFWNNLYFVTGTDIVKCLIYRFQLFGRTIIDRKKFEEGIFSDLRNLKCGTDAILEPPKSPFLEFLYKNSCLRTQKKQKVFFWFSVQHDKLFADALERDFKREMSDQKTTTKSEKDPALSFKYDDSKSLFDQLESHMVNQKKAIGTFDNNDNNSNNNPTSNTNLSLTQDDSLKNFVPTEDDFPLDFLPPNNDSFDPFSSNAGAQNIPNSDIFPLFGNDATLNSAGIPISSGTNNLLTINNTTGNPSSNNQIPFLDPNIFINPMLLLNPAFALQQQQQMALPNLTMNPLLNNTAVNNNNLANFDDFLLSQSELFSPSSATNPQQQQDSADLRENTSNDNDNNSASSIQKQQQQQAAAVAAAAAAAQNFSSFLNPMVGGLYNPLVLAAAMQQQQQQQQQQNKSSGTAATSNPDFLSGSGSAGMDFIGIGGIPGAPGANVPQISNGLFYDQQQQQQQLLGNLLGGAGTPGTAGTVPGIPTTTAAAMAAAAASPLGGLFPFNMNNFLGGNAANNMMGISQTPQATGIQLSMDEINQLQRQRLQQQYLQQLVASARMMKLRQQQVATGKITKPDNLNNSGASSNKNGKAIDQSDDPSNVLSKSLDNTYTNNAGGNNTITGNTVTGNTLGSSNGSGDWTSEITEGFGDIFSGSGSDNNDK